MVNRYLFLIRQKFGGDPYVDSFFKVRTPDGLNSEQMKVMTKLKEDFCSDELKADSAAYQGMELRLRFNTDFYQHICLIRSEVEITAEDLDMIVTERHRIGKLTEFLDESKI